MSIKILPLKETQNDSAATGSLLDYKKFLQAENRKGELFQQQKSTRTSGQMLNKNVEYKYTLAENTSPKIPNVIDKDSDCANKEEKDEKVRGFGKIFKQDTAPSSYGSQTISQAQLEWPQEKLKDQLKETEVKSIDEINLNVNENQDDKILLEYNNYIEKNKIKSGQPTHDLSNAEIIKYNSFVKNIEVEDKKNRFSSLKPPKNPDFESNYSSKSSGSTKENFIKRKNSLTSQENLEIISGHASNKESQGRSKKIESKAFEELHNDDFFNNVDISKDSEEGTKQTVNESFKNNAWNKNTKDEVFRTFGDKSEDSFSSGKQRRSLKDQQINILNHDIILKKPYSDNNQEELKKDIDYNIGSKDQSFGGAIDIYTRKRSGSFKVKEKELQEAELTKIEEQESSSKHRLSEVSNSEDVDSQQAEKINPDANNFSMSIKEANSILKDDFNELPARSSLLNMRGSIPPMEKIEHSDYWSFSKKEAQESKAKAHQEATLSQAQNTQKLNTLVEKPVQKFSIPFDDISNISMNQDISKKEDPSLLSKINLVKNGKFISSQRDVSPDTSQNFSIEFSRLSHFAPNYDPSQSKKLNFNSFKGFNRKPISSNRDFRSRGHTKNVSMIENMSLEELSTSLEKINPKIHEGITSTSMFGRAEGLGDKSFDEFNHNNLIDIKDKKRDNSPYLDYLADSYRSRKRSPIDQYRFSDKIIEIDDKPVLPKMKVHEEREQSSRSVPRSSKESKGFAWGKDKIKKLLGVGRKVSKNIE